MMRIKLEIVPGGSEEGALVKEFETAPVFTGNGDVDYVCGHCEAILAKNMRLDQIKNLVLECPKCGKYNKFP
jgi:DNA-directed RNA polymerase subunit RPC12/RpoP